MKDEDARHIGEALQHNTVIFHRFSRSSQTSLFFYPTDT